MIRLRFQSIVGGHYTARIESILKRYESRLLRDGRSKDVARNPAALTPVSCSAAIERIVYQRGPQL